MRFYHIDLLADLGTDRLTWRRLAVLLRYLPREAAYVQAVGGPATQWSATEHLLAGVIDVVQVGNYLTTRAHFKGNPDPPKPVRRPGDRPERSNRLGNRSYTKDQMRKILDRWRKGKDPLEVSDGG